MRTWYLFTCPVCGQFDKQLNSESDNLRETECPMCKKLSGRKYVSPGVVFNGPGFHINDYKGK